MSTAYIVKEVNTGKYLSKKDWCRPAIGKLPVLFATLDEANHAADTLHACLDRAVASEQRSLDALTKDVVKYTKAVKRSLQDYDAAKEIGSKELIKAAKKYYDRAVGQLDETNRSISTNRAQLTKAAKAAESVFVVTAIALP